ncbi:unnamed protein product, partial [marine sediment metagenome]
LKDCSGLSVMDVGCGYGEYMAESIKRGGIAYGLDSDIYQMALAHIYFVEKLGISESDYHLFHHDIQEAFKEGKLFDAVFCLNVMEHIPREKVALKNIINLSKVGGRVFFIVPIGMKLSGKDDSEEKKKEKELADGCGFNVFFPIDFVNESIRSRGDKHVREYKEDELVEKLKVFPVEVVVNEIFSALAERDDVYTSQLIVVRKVE